MNRRSARISTRPLFLPVTVALVAWVHAFSVPAAPDTAALGAVPAAVSTSPGGTDLVGQAWRKWEDNDHQEVERLFRAAIDADNGNARPWLGLSFLYQLEERPEEAWGAFEEALERLDAPYPYLFAELNTLKTFVHRQDNNPRMIELLLRLVEGADKQGILEAGACGRLGEEFEWRNELEKSRAFHDRNHPIRDWMLIGPFENISASGFDKVFPPETECEFEKTYEGRNGVPAEWFRIAAVRRDGWIDLLRYFAYPSSVFYGNTFVYSPARQTAQIRVGTSGSLKVFLNDEMILSWEDENNNDLDTYVAETELQKGWNRLLIKCGYSEISQCNFLARVTDGRGEPVPGVKTSTELKPYPSRPGAPVKIVRNFAEVFFEERVASRPDDLENYLLLADCYLRNDKAVEAELVLRRAVERAPGCALFHNHLIEAYIRGEKYDEADTARERIYTLDPDIPTILEYKFGSYIENSDMDSAARMLARMEDLRPGSPNVYICRATLQAHKELVDKVVATSREGYEKYPGYWALALTEANISVSTTRQYDRAIEVLEDFCKRKLTADALTTLASTYLNAMDVEGWERTFHRLLELDPAATGFHHQMASVYYQLQQYDKAEAAIRTCLDYCPGSSLYWQTLGEIKRATGAESEAAEAFGKALVYYPPNYDARDKLRELEGKPPIFSHFGETDVKRIVDSAPDADEHPEDDAIILLDDMQRVVYEKGASEFRNEILIKVFNSDGIDHFKEYNLPYNSNTQELVVDKAVVLKADGSEVSADVGDGRAVLKTLEVGDVIHLKWRIRNHFTGKLAAHFWDSINFNLFFPVEEVRYAVLLPQDYPFFFNTQGMPEAPSEKRTTEDGVLYRWRLTGQEPVRHEYNMPVLDDVGKVLRVSSIDSWAYIANWFADLAQTKTRSSFEVREAVDRILADEPGGAGATSDEKIRRIANYITENIRYSSVSFRQSAHIPRKARDVLVEKLGDCKDVSALGIAMLREAGVDAHFVLLNTRNEGRMANALPSVCFNHAIIGVDRPDGTLFLDLTAHNYPVGSVPSMDRGAFMLEIKPGVDAPGYLEPHHLAPRTVARTAEVTTGEDNSARIVRRTVRSGDRAASFRGTYRIMGQQQREKKMTEVLARYFPNLTLDRFHIVNPDDVEAPVIYEYDFTVPDFLTDAGSFKLFRIPWSDDVVARKALSYESRTYDYNYWPSTDEYMEEMTIKLPPGYAPMELTEDVELACPIAEYRLKLSYGDGVITARREMINKQDTVSTEQYQEFKAFYNNVLKNDTMQILLKRNE